jgi:pimeloyl-ACP methyl ester carboxylesterase
MRQAPAVLVFSLIFIAYSWAQDVQLPQATKALREIKLPTPTGPFAVGRVSFHWIEDPTGQTNAANSVGHRDLMAHIWYPAGQESTLKPAPYIPGLESIEGQLKKTGDAVFDRLRLVRSHTLAEAKLSTARQRFPVLIFLHGASMSAFQYASEIEELVSQGYVVVGVDSPQVALAVLFPDGRVAVAESFPKLAPQEQREWANKGSIRQALDAQIALNQLEALNARDPAGRFTGRLDLNRVGVLGHSSGGRAAIYACSMDVRVKACLTLSGFPEPTQVPEAGITKPLMFIENFDNLNDPLDEELAARGMTREKYNALVESHIRQRQMIVEKAAKSVGYLVDVRGARHNSFSDIPFLFPEEYRGKQLEGARVARVTNDYILAFFNNHLQGEGVRLLGRASPDHPEVLLGSYRIETKKWEIHGGSKFCLGLGKPLCN